MSYLAEMLRAKSIGIVAHFYMDPQVGGGGQQGEVPVEGGGQQRRGRRGATGEGGGVWKGGRGGLKQGLSTSTLSPPGSTKCVPLPPDGI